MSSDTNIAALLAKFGSVSHSSITAGDTTATSNSSQSSESASNLLDTLSCVKTAAEQSDPLSVTSGPMLSNIVQPSSIGTTSPAPLSAADQIIARIADLQKQLQEQSPGYEYLLHEIHVALAKDENILTLLSEEQIGIIVAGLSKKKNIVIAEQVATGKGRKKSVSVDDI